MARAPAVSPAERAVNAPGDTSDQVIDRGVDSLLLDNEGKLIREHEEDQRRDRLDQILEDMADFVGPGKYLGQRIKDVDFCQQIPETAAPNEPQDPRCRFRRDPYVAHRSLTLSKSCMFVQYADARPPYRAALRRIRAVRNPADVRLRPYAAVPPADARDNRRVGSKAGGYSPPNEVHLVRREEMLSAGGAAHGAERAQVARS